MAPRLFRTAIFCALLAGFAVSATGARAQDLLTVSGVEVDVTGDSAAAARSSAFTLAQRKAFEKLLGQLVDPASAASLPELSDDQISTMVSDFEIESEQTSTVRYIGVLTFRFYGEPVRRYLSGTGARFTATQSPPVLVIPVLTQGETSVLWDDTNEWLVAWAQHGGGGLVPVRVPLGDIEDIAAVDAQRALDGDLASLDALARRYGAADTVVAEARVDPAGIDASGETLIQIVAKRYGPTGLVSSMVDEVSGSALDMPALYAMAVNAVDGELQQVWKSESLATTVTGPTSQIDVTAVIGTFAEWVEMRRRLDQIPLIRRVDMRYMAMGEAQFELVYDGDPVRLQQALAGRGLQLASTGGEWALFMSGGFTPTITTTPEPETGNANDPVLSEPGATGTDQSIPTQF